MPQLPTSAQEPARSSQGGGEQRGLRSRVSQARLNEVSGDLPSRKLGSQGHHRRALPHGSLLFEPCRRTPKCLADLLISPLRLRTKVRGLAQPLAPGGTTFQRSALEAPSTTDRLPWIGWQN